MISGMAAPPAHVIKADTFPQAPALIGEPRLWQNSGGKTASLRKGTVTILTFWTHKPKW